MSRPVEPRPVGPFPAPPFDAKGPAMRGAWQRGFDSRERLGLERVHSSHPRDYHNPYSGHTRCAGPLFHGMTWGFQLAHSWRNGWNDADSMLAKATT